MRRFLVWLCSLSLIFCVVSGAALAVEIPNIENMGIDPWSDFEMISQSMGGAHLMPASDDVYVMSDDVGVMSLMDLSDLSWTAEVKGFAAYGVDEDDDEWEGSPVYYPAWSVSSGNFDAYQLWNGKTVSRSSPVNSFVPVSRSGCWVGRPAVVSGDPFITIDSSYYLNPGSVIFTVSNWEEEKGVSSLQLLDLSFRFGLCFGYWDDPNSTRLWPTSRFGRNDFTGGHFDSVHLLVNGKDVGAIDCSFSSSFSPDNYMGCSVDISDSIVSFDEQMVRSVAFEMRFGRVSLKGQHDFPGGVGVVFGYPYSSSLGNGPVVSSTARIVSVGDSAAETAGLLQRILGFLQGIVDGITQLPGKIATAIMNGLKSLFIPDQDFIIQWKSDFFTMLETKFGFIYQCFEMLGEFFDQFVLQWGSATDYVFKFPTVEFTVQGTTYTVIQEQQVSFDNPVMDIIRPFLGTFVSIIFVLGFVHSMEEMFVAIISGWSYFSYLKRDGGAAGEEEENL